MIKVILYILSMAVIVSGCGGARAPFDNVPTANEVQTISSNAVLTWQMPDSYVDNSPMLPSNIGGYRIYIGTNEANMSINATINNPSITQFEISGLGTGIRYIGLSCFDTNDVESVLSEIIIINII